MSRSTTSKSARVLDDWQPRNPVVQAVKSAAAWACVVAVAAVGGVLMVSNRKFGFAFAAIMLAFGVFVADPILLVVIALPGVMLLQRIGGASTNLSVADLLVFLAGVISLFHIRWKDAPFLRQFMRGVVWYEAVLILVVVAHPNRYNVVEWFHRFSYLGASVLAGWVIAKSGRIRQAFRLFLAGAAVLAVIAMGVAVALHFHPAQFGAYQKNSIGAVMWVAIVVAQINPSWTGIKRGQARIVKYLCLVGLLATQSRQSAILLVVALGAALFLSPELRRRGKILLLAAVPVVVLVYYSFSINARNNPQFNSVAIRVGQISAAMHVWRLSPILGEGMRFYNLPQYVAVTAPPNVVIDNLASTGILGSVAFIFLVVITMRTMYRLPYTLGTLGLVLLLGHYVGGLFDIFWLGGPTVGPLIIAGVCLGLADMDRMKGDEQPAVAVEPAGEATAAPDRRSLRPVSRSVMAGVAARLSAARGVLLSGL
jgi:hypothetical protein